MGQPARRAPARRRRYDGVLGMWYGKAPGARPRGRRPPPRQLRRRRRARRRARARRRRPGCKSSTLPSASEAAARRASHMPILFPGNVQEVLDLGRHALRAVARVAGSGSASRSSPPSPTARAPPTSHPDRVVPVIPTVESTASRSCTTPNGNLLPPVHARHGARAPTGRARAGARATRARTGSTAIDGRPADAWLGHRRRRQDLLRPARGAARARARRRRARARAASASSSSACSARSSRQIVREFARGPRRGPRGRGEAPVVEMLVKERALRRRRRARASSASATSAGEPLVPARRRARRRPHRPRRRRAGSTRGVQLDSVERARCAGSPRSRGRRGQLPMATRTPFFCSGCPHNTLDQGARGHARRRRHRLPRDGRC